MNNTAQWIVHPMLQKLKWEIDTWKCDGVYAFYNRMDVVPIGDADAPVADSYAMLDEIGALMEHFHVGADAHIPTLKHYDYTPDHLDIGLRFDLADTAQAHSSRRWGLPLPQSVTVRTASARRQPPLTSAPLKLMKKLTSPRSVRSPTPI